METTTQWPDDEGPARLPLGKHCWVVDFPGHPGAWPGLLAEWYRQQDGTWLGRVAVIAGTAEKPHPVKLWFNARYLRAIETVAPVATNSDAARTPHPKEPRSDARPCIATLARLRTESRSGRRRCSTGGW